MIVEITAQEVLIGCRRKLGLPELREPKLDDVLLASLLRYSAGINCPCSRATLRASLLESLGYLADEEDALADRIDSGIEALVVGGDLLELSDVALDDSAGKGTWVFAAPPSYVVRPSGSIFLLGIVPDLDSFLPQSIALRVTYEGFTRLITPEPGEKLAVMLEEQGLQALSESAWLKSPKLQPAEFVLSEMQSRLAAQPHSGEIKDLEVLDPTRPVAFYRGRWMKSKAHSGMFVARRPQDFGAAIWCFVELAGGACIRLLDLPLKKARWRGCDVAWHLQMAIDCVRHVPQLYRRRRDGSGIRLDFYSPLPLWAERRLLIFGRPVPRDRSLISYWLPALEAETEERFLQQWLWLTPAQDSD